MKKRGVIVGPSLKRNSFDAAVPKEELNKLLLYWDKISYPNLCIGNPNPMMMSVNLKAATHMQLLVDAGFLSVDDVEVDPATVFPDFWRTGTITVSHPQDLLKLNVIGQIELAKERLKNGEIWSIAQTGLSLSFPSKQQEVSNYLTELSLHNCLPAPTPDTSTEKIVEFKEARADELLQLRETIESFRSAILNSQEPEREIALIGEEISNSLVTLHRVLDEKKIEHFFETLKVYLDIKPNDLVTIGAGLLLTGTGIPIQAGAAIGLRANVLIKAAERLIVGVERVPEELRGYMYLYEAQKQGVVSR